MQFMMPMAMPPMPAMPMPMPMQPSASPGVFGAFGRIQALVDLATFLHKESKLPFSSAFQLAQMTMRAQERAASQGALAQAQMRRAADLRSQREEAARLLSTGKYHVESMPGDFAGSAAAAASASYADKVALAQLKSESKIQTKRRLLDIKRAESAALAQLDADAANVSADAKVATAASRRKKRRAGGGGAAGVDYDDDHANAVLMAQMQELRAGFTELLQNLSQSSKSASASAKASAPAVMTSTEREDARARAVELVDALTDTRTTRRGVKEAADTLTRLYHDDVAAAITDVAAMQVVAAGSHDRKRARRVKFLARVQRALESRAAFLLARAKAEAKAEVKAEAVTAANTAAVAARTPAMPAPPRATPPTLPTLARQQPIVPTASPDTELMPAVTETATDAHGEESATTAFDDSLPPLDLLSCPEVSASSEEQKRIAAAKGEAITAQLIKHGIRGELSAPSVGPSVTLFKLKQPTDIKLNPKTVLDTRNSIAYTVDPQLKMEVGDETATINITIPSLPRRTVNICEVAAGDDFKSPQRVLPIVLGKDTADRDMVDDIATMPHMLIAGTTGSGKSNFLNVILASIMLNCTPQQCQLVLIDPKKVDMKLCTGLPHLLYPIITALDHVAPVLQALTEEMNRRLERMASVSTEKIATYNAYAQENNIPKLPHIVTIIDEWVALLGERKKTIEPLMNVLISQSRAAGIHFIIVTQRPSADMFSSFMKQNLSARACFKVTSTINSNVVLGVKGAETLLGNGDMLYKFHSNRIVRVQTPKIERRHMEVIVAFCKAHQKNMTRPLPIRANTVTFQGAGISSIRAASSAAGAGSGSTVRAGASSRLKPTWMVDEQFETAEDWATGLKKHRALTRIDSVIKEHLTVLKKGTEEDERTRFVFKTSAECRAAKLVSYTHVLERISTLTAEDEQEIAQLQSWIDDRAQRSKKNLEQLIATRRDTTTRSPQLSELARSTVKSLAQSPRPLAQNAPRAVGEMVARWLYQQFTDVSAEILEAARDHSEQKLRRLLDK
jgi:DNA segregation ATPase FtsK/SpoIIIE-like protein